MLYKIQPPTIRIEYRDGSVEIHRLVWRNVETGFVVSSLPKNLSGVRQFLDNGEADQVRAVSFVDKRGLCFERTIQLSWSRISFLPGKEQWKH